MTTQGEQTLSKQQGNMKNIVKLVPNQLKLGEATH